MDIEFSPNGTASHLSMLVNKLKSPGTLKITKVPVAVFDTWSQSHPDARLRVQFWGTTLVISMPLKLHDGTASVIAGHIAKTVETMCTAGDAVINVHTGLTTLTQNNGRKDGDMHIYSAQSGMDTLFPGIAIEVGTSDELSKTRRDTTLWVGYSDCNVKVGISCKVDTNAQNQLSKLIFDVYTFDFEAGTRTSPLGRVTKFFSLDLSEYQPGNPATIPPTTTLAIPSYAVFSDNVYPPSYPLLPAPIPPLVAPLNPLNPHDMAIWQRYEANEAARRQDIVVDFIAIADRIRTIRV